MKFTEREMTVAVEAVAVRSFAALPRLVRSRAGAASWDELSRGARYPHLAAAGELVLPALTDLPERPTVGATPAFTDEEYEAAVAGVLRSRSPEGTDDGSRRWRRTVAGAAALLRIAVEAMPVRQDPDALIVPDHL
ncbi:hypothetical protein INN71_12250 [Nocardioides sp. ChNu-153]|uniref:hypothetical protein n=1 Tax=Nocardioides sp. ChNu-153 TaxID=2779364 RepID=UPI0026557B2F|nr:hypothetical protein [Nocardioides sp. ChNu-153]MDN7122161.1 hypothetical protein [Nocardioides sp. ChNu-153]